MPQKRTAPYGTWKSPITSDLIVSESIGLGSIQLDGADTYWTESRPSESGRSVIVRRDATGHISDINPPPYNARTRVHEYGGGAYTPHDGTVYFSNFADDRLYRVTPGGAPEAITPESAYRYADLIVDAARNRIICVREDHSNPDREAENSLVAISLGDGSNQQVLASGNDFYSSPCLSPDGTRLAYLTWRHPNMPWDGTELRLHTISPDGSLDAGQLVAGSVSESIFQPLWSPDGYLHFVSDRTGWWNIYRFDGHSSVNLTPMDAEFGVPQWVFGMSTYAFASASQIVCMASSGGMTSLYSLNPSTREILPFNVPYTDISGVRANEDRVAFLGGSPTTPPSVVLMTVAGAYTEVVRQAHDLSVDDAYLSRPEPIEFATENGLTAHAFYYPPTNPDYEAPADEKPPLIVDVHGGPTGSVSSTLDLEKQYWTSRGFAVVDVNYGGSTGYGREYRQRLAGQWGVVDVQDAVNAARYLVDRGLADPTRLIIHGGSAGGYTTLAALAFSDAFAAGASYFGIADLDPFVDETHKYESRYTEGLVGPYPERVDLYRERSPIYHIDRVTSPVILFQGLDDKVVPPVQAEIMVKGLDEKGLPYAYIAYEGEGHGFRKSENIKRTLEAELSFYAQIFGFDLGDAIQPVEIENFNKVSA
jgi:dipeptidyl aminopeptidase/acylaminoacyl peptidase